MKLLFVCLGNICRSPMAEGIMRKKINEKKLDIEVDSAGTANYHVGEPPDERAINTAHHYGVNISTLRGRQFTVDDFDVFDRIYAMDSSNYKNITRLARNTGDSSKIYYFLTDGSNGLDVPDPWYGGQDGFFHTFEMLDDAAEKILLEIASESRK